MTAAHTPGPWTLNPHAAIPMVGFDVHDGGDLLPIVDVVHGRTKAVARANARLIAAAPQLAEALRVIAEACERYGLADVGDINPANVARAALAAAGVQS